MGFLERYAKLQSRVIENDPNIRIEVYDDELDTQVLAKLLVLNSIKPNLFRELDKWNKSRR